MSIRSLEIPSYIYEYRGNKYLFRNVTIMIEDNENITVSNFNQYKDKHLLTKTEIEKMENCIAVGMFDLEDIE